MFDRQDSSRTMSFACFRVTMRMAAMTVKRQNLHPHWVTITVVRSLKNQLFCTAFMDSRPNQIRVAPPSGVLLVLHR